MDVGGPKSGITVPHFMQASDCQVLSCSLLVLSMLPVIDIACPVEQVLHLIPLHEAFQELFNNILVHLFKTSLLCKNNSSHLGFMPSSKFDIDHKSQGEFLEYTPHLLWRKFLLLLVADI